MVESELAASATSWRPQWPILALVAAALVGSVTYFLIGIAIPRGALARYQFTLFTWEADHVVISLLNRAGFGPHPGLAEGDAAVRRYSSLTSQILAEQAKAAPDRHKIQDLVEERAKYSNAVARFAEEQVTEALAGVDLKRPLPLFSGVSFIWPPVSIDLTPPVHVLVRSPRDRIQRLGDSLLSPTLTTAEKEQIESLTSNSKIVTLVVPLGGIATYPSMIPADATYDDILYATAYEWVHQYFAFYPLGLAWNSTHDADVLNETSANLMAPEVLSLVQKAHPLTLPRGADGSPPPQPPPTIDFNTVMHNLRLEVDRLLAAGKISTAQQLMDRTRQDLASHGVYIRKINQAYFAFYGTYATTPQSVNPIGPELQELWSRTRNVGTFLKIVRNITSEAQLKQELARLSG